MNIVSTMVGITIMGAAAPSVMQMTLAPVEAQARSKNFSVAESSAVTFSAEWEGAESPEWASIPENCDDPVETTARAYDITCHGGKPDSNYRQTVTRSFRLKPESLGEYTNPEREFAWETPPKYSHVECLPNDPWGVMWYNDHLKAGNLDACIPSPAWSKARYLESNPDDWLYDLSSHGYGQHPDF